ncbi:MAG: glycoside hydrolase family 16 protein [bacterium]|nr:glycoside hydrolase family 16 protein [bacterium]
MRVKIFRVVLVVFCTMCLLTFASGQPAKAVFSDEFNGPRGTSFDSLKWTAETGGGGWGNQELQYYTGETDNARLDGKGNLEIRAVPVPADKALDCWYGKCRYTSARLITKGKFQFTYGRAEARIRVPEGAGVWPAFWMLGSDIDKVGWPECGEIDIMEFIGKEPSTVYGTLHGPGYSGDKAVSRSVSLYKSQKVSSGFHVFAVEWEPTQIRWYLDGKIYSTLSPKDLPAGTRWAFDKPHFLLLNFAVGGKWPGSPDSSTKFPQSMLVDYVRVTSLKD